VHGGLHLGPAVTHPMKNRLVLRRQVLQPLTDAQLVSIEGGKLPVEQTKGCTGPGCMADDTSACAPVTASLTEQCTVDCTSAPA
jgi:hypothetical protein